MVIEYIQLCQINAPQGIITNNIAISYCVPDPDGLSLFIHKLWFSFNHKYSHYVQNYIDIVCVFFNPISLSNFIQN